jgi:hypothetical protein
VNHRAALAAAAMLASLLAVASAQSGGDKAKPVASSATAKKFNHAQHGKLKQKVVTEKNCSSCHGKSTAGELAIPAKDGHQPCLASGCHVDDFLASSAKTKKADPKRYAKAAAFCLGCHNSASGDAPRNFSRPKADNAYQNNSTTEYHIELDHFAHVERKAGKCRDCHVVDEKSFALVLDTPGHAECSQCHNGKTTHAMSECASCHDTPGAGEYFTKTRKGSDTRACGSEAHLALAKSRNKSPEQVPCYKHERKEHRFWSTNRDRKADWAQGEALQCGHCHFMFADKSQWKALGGDYTTVLQIKGSAIMDNDKDRAHKRCGEVAACHRNEVDDSRGTGLCVKCHDQKLVDSLFQ